MIKKGCHTWITLLSYVKYVQIFGDDEGKWVFNTINLHHKSSSTLMVWKMIEIKDFGNKLQLLGLGMRCLIKYTTRVRDDIKRILFCQAIAL